MLVGDGAVWVNVRSDRAIVKVDPVRNQVIDIIHDVRGNMVIDGTSLWVADPESPGFWRIDTRTDQVVEQYALSPSGWLAVGAGSLWITAPLTFDDQCCP